MRPAVHMSGRTKKRQKKRRKGQPGKVGPLGNVLSKHPPDARWFGRGPLASVVAGAGLAVVVVALVIALLSGGSSGYTAIKLGAAAVALHVAVGMIRHGLRSRGLSVVVFQRGLVVKGPQTKSTIAWTDIRSWSVHAMPGLRGRYEENPKNIVELVVTTDESSTLVPDTLADFLDIQRALAEHAPCGPTIVRVKSRSSEALATS